MIEIIKKHKFILLLIFLSMISHWYIFFDPRTLNWGDWVYYYSSQAGSILDFNVYLAPFGLGATMPFGNNWVFYFIYYCCGSVGLSWDIFTRLFFIAPAVFLAPIFSYLFFKQISKYSLVAFFAACAYSFNTFFLKLQLDWLTYAYIWWVLPALLYCILNFLQKGGVGWLSFISLLVFIGIAYELRIMILVVFFACAFYFFYLLCNSKKIRRKIVDFSLLSLSVVVGVFAHAFWILPLKYGGIYGDVISKAAAAPFRSFYDLMDVFTLHMYSWSHNLVLEPFIRQPLEYRFFLLPFFAVVGVIFYFRVIRKKMNEAVYAFLLAILAVFIFFGKQSFEPFASFYAWAFKNIPLFNLYRESSKFFIIAAIPLAYFYAIGLYFLYSLFGSRKKIAACVVGIIIFFTSIYNLQHFIDQKIGGMASGRTINPDYFNIEKLLFGDPYFYRVIWIPMKPRFGFYSNSHPYISGTSLSAITKIKSVSSNVVDISSAVISNVQRSLSDNLTDMMSVKYIVVPVAELRDKKLSYGQTAKVYEIFESYGERELYISQLDQIPWLKKVDIGAEELAVYENKNYFPHIYAAEGLNYYQTDASEFGDFGQNQNLYLNADLNKNNYLQSELQSVIVPAEADPDTVAEKQALVDAMTDAKEKKAAQAGLDLYKKNLFFRDYRLDLPIDGKYRIYFKIDSILAQSRNIGVQIGNKVLLQSATKDEKDGWKYFNELELSKGEYDLKIYSGNQSIGVINAGDVVFYADDLSAPIKTPKLEYKQISATKYVVNIRGASESFPLVFSENYHSGWKLYAEPGTAASGSGEFVGEENHGTIQNENLDGGKFYDIFRRNPVLQDKHFKINNFANAWWLDLPELEKSGKIKMNADGTYDFSVYLEFEPQKYFYIGLGISLATLAGCLGCLIAAAFYKKRRRRYNIKSRQKEAHEAQTKV